MDTNKSKVSVSVYMLSNSRAEFVLVSSIVIMHRSILNKRSLDSRDIVIGIFLDLKKAFDTVDHRIMIRKLYAYGIRGSILNWFISYLEDRSQYVAFDEAHSSTQPIKCGIPQGSILGPLLFIIYINDICNVSDMSFCILYADDTTVIIKDKEISILLKTLKVELEKLSIWLKAN